MGLNALSSSAFDVEITGGVMGVVLWVDVSGCSGSETDSTADVASLFGRGCNST